MSKQKQKNQVQKIESNEVAERVKPGQPEIEFKNEYCDVVIREMAKGYSFMAACGHIGISYETGLKWCKEINAMSQARKKGESLSAIFWEKKAVDHVVTGASTVFNQAVWVFNMKNRFGWRDKIEHSGDIEKPIQLAYNPNSKPDDDGE